MPGEPHRIIHVVGPPGAGKTTLARALSDLRGPAVVESGSIVRERLRAGDLRGFGRTRQGGLPDPRRITGLVQEAVRAALHERPGDIVVEGFPRSGAQVRRWLRSPPSDGQVVAIWLDERDADALLDRIARRSVCSACGRPATLDVACATTGCQGRHERRADADPELERRRIEGQRGHLDATMAEFARHGVPIISIPAMRPAACVLADALDALDGLGAADPAVRPRDTLRP